MASPAVATPIVVRARASSPRSATITGSVLVIGVPKRRLAKTARTTSPAWAGVAIAASDAR